MAYKFTMMNGLATVHCEISNVAFGDLMGIPKTFEILDKEAQHVRDQPA
jgi:hypothetical protein